MLAAVSENICRVRWEDHLDIIQDYLRWRPVMTADQFVVAVVKNVPYEITTAYAIIRSLYPGSDNKVATTTLFLLIIILSVFTIFLYRKAAVASYATAVSLGVCFFLAALSWDADSFRTWISDLESVPASLALLLMDLTQRFYLISAMVLIVLSSSALRKILGQQSGDHR